MVNTINKNNQKPPKSEFSLLRPILTSSQSFLIWWSGADNQKLPQHLKKSYAGLGTMAIVSTTLATFGGYTFVLISLGSPLGGIFAGVLAGSFMWGMDRNILGFSTQKESKNNNLANNIFNLPFLVKLLVNIAFSTTLTTPLTVLMLMGAVQEKNIEKIESKIEIKEESIENKEEEIKEFRENYSKIRSQFRQRYHAEGNNQNQPTNSGKEETAKPKTNGKNSNQIIANNNLTSGDKNYPNGNQNKQINSDNGKTVKQIDNGENSIHKTTPPEHIANFLRQIKRKK